MFSWKLQFEVLHLSPLYCRVLMLFCPPPPPYMIILILDPITRKKEEMSPLIKYLNMSHVLFLVNYSPSCFLFSIIWVTNSISDSARPNYFSLFLLSTYKLQFTYHIIGLPLAQGINSSFRGGFIHLCMSIRTVWNWMKVFTVHCALLPNDRRTVARGKTWLYPRRSLFVMSCT